MADNRISELPDVIIQHIQSFLETKEVAPTILLSKSWLRAWSTRPFLDFKYRSRWTKLIFSQKVDRTLERYVEEGIPIVKLNLHLDTIEERWLRLVRQSNVIELDISSVTPTGWLSAVFWLEIFLTKSLQVLRVQYHHVSQLVLSRTDIKCFNLKKLELRHVQIDEVTLQHIMCSCPLIEELILEHCTLLDLCPSNLGIQSCAFEGEFSSLKRLSLVKTAIDDEQLQTILFKSTKLEDLNLSCDSLESIKLSSLSLKLLNIRRTYEQVVLIDAPNLLKLNYKSRTGIVTTTAFPITITSPVTKGMVEATIYHNNSFIGELWFHGLREFLSMFEKSNVKFNSRDSPILSFDFKVFTANPLPRWHEVETLRFETESGWLINLPLLYAFFTICHPKTLLLALTEIFSEEMRESLRNLYKVLRYGGKQKCCKLAPNKCWRHYIKGAKLYYVVDNEQKPLDITEPITGSENWDLITLALKWKSFD